MEDYGNGNGSMQRTEGFGETTALAVHETASTAAAEQAKAEVQARFIMALRMPRDMDTVRVKLLKECKRSSFAEVAIYRKPVGGSSIEGLSIRFAEAAIRSLGNLMPQTMVIYDDDEKMIGRVMLTDLEGNVTFQRDIVVRKVVERKKLKKNQKPLGERLNSFGDKVYLVKATDDEVATKFASLESKSLRNHALRILPGDIQDECIATIKSTRTQQHRQDPDKMRKKITDDFAALGIHPPELVRFLGHDLDRISASEGEQLWSIQQAITSGEASWEDFADADDGGDPDKPNPKKRTNKVKDLLDKKTTKAQTVVDAPPPAEKPAAPPQEPPPQGEAHDPKEDMDWHAAIDQAKEAHGGEVVAAIHHALELPRDRRGAWTAEQVHLSKVACRMLIDSARTPNQDEVEMFADLVRSNAGL